MYTFFHDNAYLLLIGAHKSTRKNIVILATYINAASTLKTFYKATQKGPPSSDFAAGD